MRIRARSKFVCLPLIAAAAALFACSSGGGGDTGPRLATGGSGGSGGKKVGTGGVGGTHSDAGSGATGATGGSGGSNPASGGAAGSAPLPGLIEPGDPGSADVSFTIRADQDAHSISRWIYGVNGDADFNGAQAGIGLLRQGGNRLTAYNWETNASNAGSDWQYSNDNYMSSSKTPGEAVRVPTQNALDHGAAMIVTVPIAGYVSADESGPVDPKASPAQSSHFHPIVAKKNGALSLTPDTGDNAVYADEFVNWVKNQFPAAFQKTPAQVLFSLDNEPDLWSDTHPEVHPAKVTYAELTQKNAEFGAAIKDVAPNALVTGFVSYGYNGYTTLQNAPDSSSNADFIAYYLDQMKAAEASHGKRVVDVLDLHWYTEVYANGQRITGNDTSQASIDARVQAPRSLWDPGYKEESWISGAIGGPIALIPSMKQKIDQHYPGTTLGFTEYNYGGSDHISGAIAEADVLGIFGREGVQVATFWPLSGKSTMVYAALRAFTSYDGNGAAFGDTGVRAETNSVEKATVYASYDAANPKRMVIVAINKTTSTLTAAVTMAAYGSYTAADVYRLSGDSTTIAALSPIQTTAQNALLLPMPPLSISVLVPH